MFCILLPLNLPTASISSINSTHGAESIACCQSFLILAAPTPTNISMKSEPAVAISGTPASPAIALAIRVLPVPGGPSNKMPRTGLAPIALSVPLLRSCSTAKRTSSLVSDIPRTSLKVTGTPLAFSAFIALLNITVRSIVAHSTSMIIINIIPTNVLVNACIGVPVTYLTSIPLDMMSVLNPAVSGSIKEYSASFV